MHHEHGITLIVVTHDPSIARRADRVISIRDGRIESDLPSARAPASPAEHAEPQAYALAGAIAGAYAGPLVGVAAVASANGNGSVEDAAGTIGAAVSNVGVDPVAPAEPAQPARKLRPAQVWKRGLIAVAIAIVVNVGLALAAQTLFPVAGRLPIFGLAPVALFTAVFGLIGVALFALLNRRMENPARVFRWVAVGALVLSFVPNIALIMNPALLRQIPGGFGAGQARFAWTGHWPRRPICRWAAGRAVRQRPARWHTGWPRGTRKLRPWARTAGRRLRRRCCRKRGR